MQRDRAHLLDILESSRLARTYVANKSLEAFLQDVQCQDAVIRRLEIVGEAVRRLSQETRSSLPDVPWNDIMGMRNILVHEYGEIDLIIVWDTLQSNLPRLVSTLEEHLGPDDT